MGCGSSERLCSGGPPSRRLRRHWGELSVFQAWAPPHCCGSWLRPGLLPPIGFSFPLFLFCVLLPCPSAFGSLWAGNQVTGGTGGTGSTGSTGDRGCRECEDAVGLKNSLDGMADSAPGALPPGPRQGLLAPGPPPRGEGPPWNRHSRWRGGGATA